jgi:Pyruvate/2-oxoacid:ferredoxin oxidoreductase delta subunit
LIVRRVARAESTPIRPPGALPEERLSAACARCGNCTRVCPEGILHPDLGASGVAGLLTPVVRIEPGYCSEWCNACNRVCPTGAIARMGLDEKRTVSIGTARVEHKLCLAWERHQHCVVCDEYCAYHAVKTVMHGGVPCPEVDPDVCRGCGLCQTVCPAEQVAIVVHAKPQKRLPPVEL